MNDIVQHRPRRARPSPDETPSHRTADARRWGGLLAAQRVAHAGWRSCLRHVALYSQHREAMAMAEQHRDFVPTVRVATVERKRYGCDSSPCRPRPRHSRQRTSIARASGYIDKRYVDIGDHVKEGQLLAEIGARSSITRSPKPRPRSSRRRPPFTRHRRTWSWRGDVGARPSSRRARMDHPAAGHDRRPDTSRRSRRRERCAIERCGAAGAGSRARPEERSISASSHPSTA